VDEMAIGGAGARDSTAAARESLVRSRQRVAAEEWFGIAELARRLDVSEDLIRRKVQRHEVPYYKVGKLIRFNSNEIKQWLASLRIDPLF
jgi:excisionase family DNA binding protein